MEVSYSDVPLVGVVNYQNNSEFSQPNMFLFGRNDSSFLNFASTNTFLGLKIKVTR